MLDFKNWLKENGLRTSLGPYPPAYGAFQYPAAYFMPIAADANRKLDVYHDGGTETNPHKKKKAKHKKSKHKK